MKPLFVDVDTQNDFVLPAGALYAPGAEQVIPPVAKLNRYAQSQAFHLISTACHHAEVDPEFKIWAPHCIAGTVGQLKPSATLTGQRIFGKQHTDVFRSPHWLPLLQELEATEYVVYGVVTEVCVRQAAEGLLRLGKPVAIVSDAVWPFRQAVADDFLQAFRNNGGKVVTSGELLATM